MVTCFPFDRPSELVKPLRLNENPKAIIHIVEIRKYITNRVFSVRNARFGSPLGP